MSADRTDISIVLCGEAGQGIQTVENVLVRLLKRSGFHVFATKEYMSRIRGGVNSTVIRAGGERVRAYSERIDLLLPLGRGGLRHLARRISAETVLAGEPEHLEGDVPGARLEVPLKRLAAEAGSKAPVNMAALGVAAGLLALEGEVVARVIRETFSGKDQAQVEANVVAAAKGAEAGRNLVRGGFFRPPPFRAVNDVSEEIVLSGAEAVGLGALAGGCDFLSSYPMSPSTGVMTFLAGRAKDFGVVVEQAEDEISAVNMALGAWYAGGRAMVTTSGGGFALMVEGLSLAGMLESPLVIHVGQRPGPATGLPTRTEQADLEFVLRAGHGEFPRVILAPGTLEEGFDLTRRAFDTADRYQIPVFILSDQYFMDSLYNLPPFDVAGGPPERRFVRTAKDYRRYALTPDGVSPRGIPGFGEGLVSVDSDEHDEEGHITEDLKLRKVMVEKRLRKGAAAAGAAVAPRWTGPAEAKDVVVSWGSTGPIIEEALGVLGRRDAAHLHFAQVHPLHADAGALLRRARRRVCVEGNATGQFRRLLEAASGVSIEHGILKYDGLPFSVEEVAEGLGGLLDGGG
ncbi:MAG: 2-oxoacid:acceptor oxidoreductase subunit alpha [Candidatus Aminicenantes bacterium]|nr:2-oxoacid:acceptor oxidoreductase subunit alpha [Candidatus Aminicenantes bacterium]